MKLLLLSACACPITAWSPMRAAALDEWHKFKATFSRDYATAEEEALRFEIFTINLELITLENAKNHSYELGVTQFADLTGAEFQRQLQLPAQIARPANISSARLHRWGGEELPTSVDWEAAGATTPVLDENKN
eukprot:3708760-Prymnesium_polylepis.1